LEALGDLFIEFGGEGRVGGGSEFLQLAQTTQSPFPDGPFLTAGTGLTLGFAIICVSSS
jgi:hypothetical protein